MEKITYIIEIEWDEDYSGELTEEVMEVVGVNIQKAIDQRHYGKISVKLALPLGYPF